ncbi:hypothetical protein XTPLMG728_1943 [Xanthomonas translucens pv. poae]|uniref:Uncharacterized protein n=1 Tax=Xanthomonas graminis pv. poae TaxID=227946 RepID=A0A0K2ZU73_9XANT|nr:hypothetical protein XTPLMG728_1943 [Xanthomonas translucens pv. poae]
MPSRLKPPTSGILISIGSPWRHQAFLPPLRRPHAKMADPKARRSRVAQTPAQGYWVLVPELSLDSALCVSSALIDCTSATSSVPSAWLSSSRFCRKL